MTSVALVLLLAAAAAGDHPGLAWPKEIVCPRGSQPAPSRGRPPPPPGAPPTETTPEVTQFVCKDAQGNKQGPFIARTDAGVTTARGAFVDDKADGPWTFYGLDGKKLAEMKARRGLPAGDTVIYYPSGKVRARTSSDDSGAYVFTDTFYESGAKASVHVIDRRNNVGHFTAFHERGPKSSEGTTAGAGRRGTWHEWAENGEVLATTTYDDKGEMKTCAGPRCPPGTPRP
jgi:hypothetical protein